MKILTVILLLLTTAEFNNSQFACPLNSELKPIDGSFPDPDYCGIYYHCINGTAHPQQCPPGLLFTISITNCKYSLCVEPSQADCPGGNSTTIIESDYAPECSTNDDAVNTFETSCYLKNSDCEDGQNGTFPNKNDCRQYYHCYNGVAWPQQCPQGYFFSPSINIRDCTTRICVTAEESKCPIPGQWSEWSGWSGCDPNCGDGLRTRVRSCTNPPPSNGGVECPGNSVDIELCSNPPCNINKNPAFMVSLTRTTSVSIGRIAWHKVNHDNGDLFNTTTNSLNIKKNGFYFLSSTGTTSLSTSTSFLMSTNNVGLDIGLYQSDSFKKDTFSRSGIYSLTPLSQPYMSFDFSTTAVGSETGFQTSWSGFRYETNNVFFIGTNADFSRTAQPIPLPIVVTLRGAALDSGRREITLSTKGWYFIKFGTGFSSSRNCVVSLTINGESRSSERSIAKNHRALRFSQASRGVIVELNENDRISLKLVAGYSRSSRMYTYISGFKLNATEESPAFYAYRTDTLLSPIRVKIDYDAILLDTNSGWNSADRTYKVAVAGLYYIDVSVGTMPNIQSVIYIMVNSEQMLGMQRVRVQPDFESMSRGGLLKLEQGDTVSVETNRHAYSAIWKLTSIALFYVSPL